MVYGMLIGAGLQMAGGYLSSQAAKKAAAKERARQIKENEERRKLILEASESAAETIEQSANPLLSQAKGMERASKYRDPLVEQGLVSGLRQQAGAQATQGRQLGQGDRRGAVVGQLLRGQGLLAAESQRIQRFTQMSQAAAGLRSQSAQIMGQASQARMEGALAAANIKYTGPIDTGGSDWGTALGALGGAVMGMDFTGPDRSGGEDAGSQAMRSDPNYNPAEAPDLSSLPGVAPTLPGGPGGSPFTAPKMDKFNMPPGAPKPAGLPGLPGGPGGWLSGLFGSNQTTDESLEF